MAKRRSDTIIGRVMGILTMRRQYFLDARSEIVKYNLRTMQNASLAGLIMLFFLILVSPYIVRGWKPTLEYWSLAPTLMIFFLFSFFYDKKGHRSYYIVQGACSLFYVAIFAHFIAISVFPYPDSPESYITILLLVMPVLFILRPYIVLCISIIMGSIFCLLVVSYKTPVCVSHDLFSAFAGVLFGQFISMFVYSLRVSDYHSRASLYEWSRTDPLTGLLNKAACETTVGAYLQYRWKNEDFAVMMMDVDDFKKINDTLGHPQGDKMLRATGVALRNVFRKTDILARVGGDEFLLVMKDVRSQATVLERARDMNVTVSEFVRERTGISLSYSVGVFFGKGDESYEECLKCADEALYIAKRSGKNGYSVWKDAAQA